MKKRVKNITDHISIGIFAVPFYLRVEEDQVFGGRVFVQVVYNARCTKSGEMTKWHGRKWYLSEHMTDDEIVKTAYVAFEMAVKHEVMESFLFDGIPVFNPHVNYEALLSVSDQEVSRNNN